MTLGLLSAIVVTGAVVLMAGVLGVGFLVWSAPAFWQYGAVRGLARHFGRHP